ncbi:MAG: hypothetical protein H6631_00475 [Anaerolineaceae bacterium]|nr:hypothetical protein [Anaerolineaceae bacterium]MCB9100269.1 hypothetical protein [Anaerolineales bacterium]
MTMNLIARYQSRRNHFWPEIEKFFTGLPPTLFQQGILLQNNLATFYAETGQFSDILSREHDHPCLYLHFWLIDDWQSATLGDREPLEKSLFLTAVFNFAAVYAQEAILDEGTNFDQTYLFLAQSLRQQADRHLMGIFPGTDAFWRYHQLGWNDYAEATLADTSNSNLAKLLLDEEAGAILPRRLAFTQLPIIGAAMALGRAEDVPLLSRLVDHLNFVWQLLRDISTIRRDLTRQRYTYPILKTLEAAGLDPHQAPLPEQILGALVLTGVMSQIEQICTGQLTSARELAQSLNLPTLVEYCPVVENQVRDVVDLFSLKPQLKKPVGEAEKPRRPMFAPFVETLPKVIEMAEGYLLADISFRESWEVQRRGVFNVPEMIGRAFPAGFITEILSRYGHNMAQSIDMVFETLAATGFRYYNHDHLPPDADDVGLALRLLPYSPQPERHRAMLQAPAELLAARISPAGEIPVWLVTGAEPDSTRFVSLWGNTCAAVSANALLGLMSYDRSRYQPLIDKCADNLFNDISQKGVGAGWHYKPLYTIWIIFELMAHLPAQSMRVGLARNRPAAAQILTERFKEEVQRYHVTPQDAALLSLVCLSAGAPDEVKALFKADWITILTKTQRYDGCWPGEPLYGTPTRGELATWYASNSVTTALCYHALKRFRL